MRKYTNKQKIKILEKVIVYLQAIIDSKDYLQWSSIGYQSKGICTIAYFEIMHPTFSNFREPGYEYITDYIKDLFGFRFRLNKYNSYAWPIRTEEGYKSRIRVCKAAIRRLRK